MTTLTVSLNTEYMKSIQAIIKYVQVVLHIICIICVTTEGYSYYYGNHQIRMYFLMMCTTFLITAVMSLVTNVSTTLPIANEFTILHENIQNSFGAFFVFTASMTLCGDLKGAGSIIAMIFSLMNAVTYFAALFPALRIKRINNNNFANNIPTVVPPIIENERKYQPIHI